MVVYTGGFSPQDSATAADALARDRLRHPRRAERGADLGDRRRGDGLPADAHHVRPRPSTPSATASARPICPGVDTRRVVLIAFAISGGLQRLRRRAARRLCVQGGAVDGRRLPAAVDRRGRAGRHLDPRRPRLLSRHGRGRHPDHAAAVDPVGHADAGGRPTDHLRRRDRRHAAALRPRARVRLRPAIAETAAGTWPRHRGSARQVPAAWPPAPAASGADRSCPRQPES